MSSTQEIDNYHHGNLRSALIGTALNALEQDGPAALSLRALARSVGVSATAVYRHFANKDDLLAAIATEGFEGLSAEMTARLAQEPDADTLRRLVILGEGYVNYAVAHPAHYRLMFGKRMVERVAPDEWLFPNMNYGCVVKIDIDGTVTDCLWDRSGTNHPMITSMREHKGWLYLGGVSNNRIGRYRIPGADPEWTAAKSYRGEAA